MRRTSIFILAACLMFLAGCGLSTKLTISNQTSFSLSDVQWSGTDFGPMGIGYSKTMSVIPGSDYIYFMYASYWFRTVAMVNISRGQHPSFTLTDNTLVYGPYGGGDLSARGPEEQGEAVALKGVLEAVARNSGPNLAPELAPARTK